MKRLRKLLGLCEHKWHFIRNCNTYGYSWCKRPYKREKVYLCEKCYKSKRVRI